MRYRASVATAAVLVVGAAHVQAQEIGQPSRGFALAQQLCAECHAIQKGQARSPNTNAPRFAAIAAIPGMTSTALYATIQTSHRTMPNIILEADDIRNVIAYILSLQESR